MERSLANKLLIEDALLNLNSQNGFGRFIEERGKRDEDFMREKPIVTDVEDWSQLIQPSAKLDTVLHRDGKGTHVFRELQRRRLLVRYWCQPQRLKEGVATPAGVPYSAVAGWGSSMTMLETHEKILQASEQFRIEKLNRQYVKSVKRTQGSQESHHAETLDLNGQTKIVKLLPLEHVILKSYVSEMVPPNSTQVKFTMLAQRIEMDLVKEKKRLVNDPNANVQMMISTTSSQPLRKDCQWIGVKRDESQKVAGVMNDNYLATQDILITPKSGQLQLGAFHWIRLQNNETFSFRVEISGNYEDFVDEEQLAAAMRASEALMINVRNGIAQSEKRREMIRKGQDWKTCLGPDLDGVPLRARHMTDRPDKPPFLEEHGHNKFGRKGANRKKDKEDKGGSRDRSSHSRRRTILSNDTSETQPVKRAAEHRVDYAQRVVQRVFLPVLETTIKKSSPDVSPPRSKNLSPHKCAHVKGIEMSVEFFEASLSRTANLSRSISEMNQRARETRAASPVRFGEAEAAKVARKMAKGFKTKNRSVTVLGLCSPETPLKFNPVGAEPPTPAVPSFLPTEQPPKFVS